MTRLGATCTAAITGITLAIVMTVATLPSPPDYVLPMPNSYENAGLLQEVMGVRVGAGGGSQSRVTVARDDLLTDEGDEVLTVLHYRDTPYDLPEGFRTVLDVDEQCVRIRVASTVPHKADGGRIDAHAQYLRQHVRDYLAGAPRDPCLGRPLQP